MCAIMDKFCSYPFNFDIKFITSSIYSIIFESGSLLLGNE